MNMWTPNLVVGPARPPATVLHAGAGPWPGRRCVRKLRHRCPGAGPACQELCRPAPEGLTGQAPKDSRLNLIQDANPQAWNLGHQTPRRVAHFDVHSPTVVRGTLGQAKNKTCISRQLKTTIYAIISETLPCLVECPDPCPWTPHQPPRSATQRCPGLLKGSGAMPARPTALLFTQTPIPRRFAH